jgi:hypothetical protein
MRCSLQVKQWNIDELRGFWRQWYFPANATLYVVGEMGRPTAEVRELISSTFGRVPPGREPPQGGHAAAIGNGSSSNGNGVGPHVSQQQQGALKMRHPVRPQHYVAVLLENRIKGSLHNSVTCMRIFTLNKFIKCLSNAVRQTADPQPQRDWLHGKQTPSFLSVFDSVRRCAQVRPPVEHIFGSGPVETGAAPAPVSVFRHRLLQHFMLSVFCKLPVKRVTAMRDIRRVQTRPHTSLQPMSCEGRLNTTVDSMPR